MSEKFMTKAILSVKPQYANLLVDGFKCIELRKKFSCQISEGDILYIYASTSVQKIIGHVTVKRVDRLPIAELWKKSAIEAMVPWGDFKKYYEGHEFGVAIEVSKPTRYEKTIEISSFGIQRPPQSWQYIKQNQQSEAI